MSVLLLTSWVYPLAVVLLTVSRASATQYSLAKEYYGSTFFQGWTLCNSDNITYVDLVCASGGQADHIAYVDLTTSHAFIHVDNSTQAVSDNNFVRVTTNDSFEVGSLWVTDLYHVPYGCSVWPSWSSLSQAAQWPQGGEIDTFRYVDDNNVQTYNQMSLHTTMGCTQVSPNQTSTMIRGTNCSSVQGCSVWDPSSASYGVSYGAGFANTSGGAFVTEFASTGISIWFFPRSQMPSALSNNDSMINTTTFGVPVANWPGTGCNIQQYFQPQHLTFSIYHCNVPWNVSSLSNCLAGVCYNDSGSSIYDTAYFEIGYVRIFSVEGSSTVISPPSSSAHNAMVKYGSVGVSVLAVVAGLGVMFL